MFLFLFVTPSSITAQHSLFSSNTTRQPIQYFSCFFFLYTKKTYSHSFPPKKISVFIYRINIYMHTGKQLTKISQHTPQVLHLSPPKTHSPSPIKPSSSALPTSLYSYPFQCAYLPSNYLHPSCFTFPLHFFFSLYPSTLRGWIAPCPCSCPECSRMVQKIPRYIFALTAGRHAKQKEKCRSVLCPVGRQEKRRRREEREMKKKHRRRGRRRRNEIARVFSHSTSRIAAPG